MSEENTIGGQHTVGIFGAFTRQSTIYHALEPDVYNEPYTRCGRTGFGVYPYWLLDPKRVGPCLSCYSQPGWRR